ncbi:hypothetical protein S83_006480, partial [Arachis hypogaea]
LENQRQLSHDEFRRNEVFLKDSIPAFEVGSPYGNFKAPYAVNYRYMAILSKPLHKHGLR